MGRGEAKQNRAAEQRGDNTATAAGNSQEMSVDINALPTTGKPPSVDVESPVILTPEKPVGGEVDANPPHQQPPTGISEPSEEEKRQALEAALLRTEEEERQRKAAEANRLAEEEAARKAEEEEEARLRAQRPRRVEIL